jgi:hypothetical protein
MWDLWWTSGTGTDFSPSFFLFSLSISFHRGFPYSYSIWGSISQTMAQGPLAVRGGPHAVSEENALEKTVSDTERTKNTSIHVCAKSAFVGRLSLESRRISSFHNFLDLQSLFYKIRTISELRKCGKVTLPTGIMVLLFTSVHFRVWGIFYEGGPRVRRPLKEWSGIAEKFEKR